MATETLRALVAQGLQAMKAGGQVAMKATAEIENDARNPELVSALQIGNQTSEQWASRIQAALAEAGGAPDEGNPIMEAHYQVSRKIRQSAPDDTSRDLGIIASGQLALHYWIAAFGTMHSYASAIGMKQVEESMRASLEEARQGDQHMTQIAQKILRASA